MDNGAPASTLQLIGAGCFGAILGWYLYFINRYRNGPVEVWRAGDHTVQDQVVAEEANR